MTDTLMAFEDVNRIWVKENYETTEADDCSMGMEVKALSFDAAKGLELALDVLAKAISRDIDTVAQLRAEVKRLRDALKPFAMGHTGGWGHGISDEEPACHICADKKWDEERMLCFTVGHFRRAKDALGIEYPKPPEAAHTASEEGE